MWARRTPCRWPRSESHSFFALLGGCCPGTERRHRGLHQRNLWRLNAALGRGIASVDVEASPQAQAATRNLHAPPPFSPQPAPADCRPRCLRSRGASGKGTGQGFRGRRCPGPASARRASNIANPPNSPPPAAARPRAARRRAARPHTGVRNRSAQSGTGNFPIKMQTGQNAVGLWCTYARPDDRGNRPLTLPPASTGSGSEWGGVARHEEAQAN